MFCFTEVKLFRNYYVFLDAFAKLRKATISFVMSVHPSICPRGTTWLPIDGFSLNFIYEYFSNICRENSSFIKIEQEQSVLYMKSNIHFPSHLARFFVGKKKCFRQKL